MGPCDYSSASSSNTGFGIMSEILQGRSAPSNTSAPPCTPTESVSSVMLISVTVVGFVIIIFATGLIVYIFRKLGWFYVTDPATERLRELRESVSVAKPSQGLDPAEIRAFPVYTFRGDNTFSCEVTTATPGLPSFRIFSREISRSFSSSRPISRNVTISRCSTREESSSSSEALSADNPNETGSARGEFVVTIEGDDNDKVPQNDDEALIASLAWACRRECAVCLGEYAAGERIKVVPACAHGFHADCIDLWLAAKTTCPICRRDLSPGKAAVAPTDSTIPISPTTQQGDPVPDASVANGTVT
ncbi:unnamed protein product [Closterium sp. Yama58-4]|nr:unnamed protein product [Closterium sp. Yama58-4]